MSHLLCPTKCLSHQGIVYTRLLRANLVLCKAHLIRWITVQKSKNDVLHKEFQRPVGWTLCLFPGWVSEPYAVVCWEPADVYMPLLGLRKAFVEVVMFCRALWASRASVLSSSRSILLAHSSVLKLLEVIEKVSCNRLPVDSEWIGSWEQVEVQYLLSRAVFHNLRIWTSEPIEHVTDKKMNRIVEITLLCGSSIFVPKQSVISFPICMLRCRFLGMSAISFRSLSLTPDWWSFFGSPFIQTKSKASSKSMEITAPFCLFLLTSWQHNFSRYNNLTVIRCDWMSSCWACIALVILKSSVPGNLHQVIFQQLFCNS